ncbi:hypothetical protein N7475_001675 [Penicillium sp. IBT 31633x]|nr:hypothetical protein N7475_001675 [Penicillium sp. IBT 31633x]
MTTSSVAFLISDAADPRFSACQPNGWENPQASFILAQLDYRPWDRSEPFPITSLATPCYYYIDPGWTTVTVSKSASGTKTRRYLTEVYMVHAAWAISWAASDTASMSPSLPPLDSKQFIPTWVPGQSLTTPPEPKRQTDRALTQLGYIYMVGLPLIGAAVIACGVWCCFTVRRARRREAPRLEQWRLEHPTSIFKTAK